MGKYQFVNNAVSTLLSSVLPTDTVLVLPSGEGDLFPADVADTTFLLTVENTAGQLEVMECTHRAGDVLTVTRGREGTAPLSFTSGAAVECRVTAGILRYLDFTLHGNAAGGPPILDIDGNVLISQLSAPMSVYGDARWNPKLGWTPVQQGGHASMSDAVKVKLGFNAAAGFTGQLLVTAGAGAPTRLLYSTATGNTLPNRTDLAHSRFYATSLAGKEDRLYMGGQAADDNAPSGYYLSGTDASAGWVSGGFTAWRYTYATTTFSVTGSLTVNGVAVSLAGHTHAQTDITGLTTALAAKFDAAGGTITGDVVVTGSLTAASVTDTSDRRIKRNVTNMTPEDALDIVRRTRAVRFFNIATNRSDFGVIADDQQAATPELVFEDAAGMKSVAYQRMVAPLVVALQNALQRIDALESKLP